ncbi:MAG: arylesterase, partial [Halieaceae bacterium]|nr:arylesterase [Halieaceae bacterium]
IPPNYGRRYALGFRNLYPTVAGETGATLSPFIMDGVATQPALMQEDGIHPTAEAQPLLVDNMMSTIKQALQTP